MSFDNFSECSACKGQTGIRVWVQLFSSFDAAKMSGRGPEFLTAIMPGPGLLKIEVCFQCRIFRPCFEYSEEEKAAMVKYNQEQEKTAKIGENFGKLFGGMFGKEPV